MVKKFKTREIDAAKLKAELKKNGGVGKIARAIGYEGSYFTHVFKSGVLRESAVQLLENMGIKYEDYKPDEKKPEKQTTYDFTHTKYKFSREITTADIVAELIEIREILKKIAEAI